MTDRQLYLIDQYHQGKLTPDEQVAFDNEMKFIEFVDLVNLGADIAQVTRVSESNALRKKMHSWENQSDRKKIPTYIWVLLVMLVVTIGFLLIQYSSRQRLSEPDRIYAEYVKPYKNIYLPLARSEADESPQLKAMAAYENKTYEKARLLFNSIPDTSRTSGDQFYHAVSLLLSDQATPAIEMFKQLTRDAKYGIPAQWYLFLYAIKNNDREKIKSYGDVLRDQTSHTFISRQTSEILERIQ